LQKKTNAFVISVRHRALFSDRTPCRLLSNVSNPAAAILSKLSSGFSRVMNGETRWIVGG
jgi:hypothetical protein